MFVAIECNNIELAIQSANKYHVSLCENDVDGSMLIPDCKFVDILKSEFTGSCFQSEAMVYAKILDQRHLADRVLKHLDRHTVVICINYYATDFQGPKFHPNGPIPDIVIHLLEEQEQNDLLLQRFCSQNKIPYEAVTHGSSFDIRLLCVTVNTIEKGDEHQPKKANQRSEIDCQFSKQDLAQLRHANALTLEYSADAIV
jgi:hypothetical protein